MAEEILAEYSQKAQVSYEIPCLLEAAVSILMEHLQTGSRLYNDNPMTYMLCQERAWRYPDSSPLFVGGFAQDGLDLNYSQVSSDSGIAVIRKF